MGPTANDLAPLEEKKEASGKGPEKPKEKPTAAPAAGKERAKDGASDKEKAPNGKKKTSRDLMPPPSPSSYKKLKTPVHNNTKPSIQLSPSPSSVSTSFSSSYSSSSSTENSPLTLSPRTPSPPRNPNQKPVAQYEISPYQRYVYSSCPHLQSLTPILQFR